MTTGAAGYWLTPDRRHVIAWARAKWPADAGRFSSWRLARLRALWHRVNRARLAPPAPDQAAETHGRAGGPGRTGAGAPARGDSLNAAF